MLFWEVLLCKERYLFRCISELSITFDEWEPGGEYTLVELCSDEWGNGVMQNVMSGEMCAVSLVGLCEIKNVDVLSLITA